MSKQDIAPFTRCDNNVIKIIVVQGIDHLPYDYQFQA